MATGGITAHIRVTSDTWDDRLKHLSRPEFTLSRYLNPVLDAAFAETQARVHVITGSLKLSGRHEGGYDASQDEWRGEITYGGAAPGAINNPVDYAWYEQRRDGDHDFMSSVHEHLDAFAAGMGDWMTS